MKCADARGVVAVWTPHDDLPDDVVGHLEDCGACAAAFDARFPPLRHTVPAPSVEVARSRRPAWMVAAVALAALIPFLVLPGGPAPAEALAVASLLPAECPMPTELPPECPPA